MKLFTHIFFAILFYISSVSAETIPSIEIINYKDELAYIIVSSPRVVVGSDYQDACNQLITSLCANVSETKFSVKLRKWRYEESRCRAYEGIKII